MYAYLERAGAASNDALLLSCSAGQQQAKGDWLNFSAAAEVI